MSKEMLLTLLVVSQAVNIISFVLFAISKRALKRQLEEANLAFEKELEEYRQAALRVRASTDHPAGMASMIFMESINNKMKGRPAMTIEEFTAGEKSLFRHYIHATEIDQLFVPAENMKRDTNVVQVDFSNRSK